MADCEFTPSRRVVIRKREARKAPTVSVCWTMALLLSRSPAFAHDVAWSVTSGWNLDPWLTVPLIIGASLYALGVGRLWRHAGLGRGVRPSQALCLGGGWLILVIGLLSPLYRLGEGLFAAHMLEHELVMLMAAPLIALARPFGGMLWALPAPWRASVGAAARRAAGARVWQMIGNAWTATALQALALWVWHAPALYNLVLADTLIHRLQHLSFFLTALLFWWSLVGPRMRRSGYGTAVLCLFVTVLQSGFLGVLLTVSPRLWYARQTVFAEAWGLTPLEDQQLAGLLMWIPAGLIYTAAALIFAALWIAHTASLAGGRRAALAR